MSIILSEIAVGQMFELKVGLSTREAERVDANTFYIHDTSSGWNTAEVSEVEMQQVLNGELRLLDLDWE